MKPIIGINCSLYISEEDKKKKVRINSDYYNAIKSAGGIPILIPILENQQDIRRVLEIVDGVLLIGGHDIDPKFYGQKKHKNTKLLLKDRNIFDMQLAKLAISINKPILAICLGVQLLNVVSGGTLIQDIPTMINTEIKHSFGNIGKFAHTVKITKGTLLHKILESDEIKVNSSHHQSIKDVGNGFRINAISPDGIIEGIENNKKNFLLGVQWHPETICKYKHHFALFQALVNAAKSYMVSTKKN